jgi:glutamate 5-kinase
MLAAVGQSWLMHVPRKGKELARGIVRYSSADLAQIKGLRSDAIADLLGYTAGPARVHRNDMILT